MVLAVLIISHASGTETEFQVIPVLFRAPAHHAAVLGALYDRRLHLFFIGTAAPHIFRRKTAAPHGQEENDKIQKRHQGRHAVGGRRQNAEFNQRTPGGASHRHDKSRHDGDDKIKPVGVAQISAFDGNDEKQQKLHVREQRRKCKKQRHVQIHGPVGQVVPAHQIDSETDQHMEDQPGKKIHVEPECAPLVLQHLPDHIIQIQREKDKDKASGGRLYDEGDNPPHLSSQNRRRIQRKITIIQIRRHHLHHEPKSVQHNNVIHKVGYGIPPEPPFHFVKPSHSIFLSCPDSLKSV